MYIVCHGGLHKNGTFLSPVEVYRWPYSGTGGVGEGVDIANNGVVTPLSAFGPKLKSDNVFACYLSKGHRKIRARWIDNPESSIVHLSEIMKGLLSALQKYKKKDLCGRRVRIYEGEYRGKNIGTEEAQKLRPLKPEDDYNVKDL